MQPSEQLPITIGQLQNRYLIDGVPTGAGAAEAMRPASNPRTAPGQQPASGGLVASFALPETTLQAAGFRAEPIERLGRLIEAHIAEGRYPGAQIALARHGKLALAKTY